MTAARPPLWLIALSATLTLGLSACGKDNPSSSPPTDDEAKIRQTVVDWYSALAHADGAGACALMTTAFRKELADEEPSMVITEGGQIERTPATCAARISRASKKTLVDEGIAPSVNNPEVTKVDIAGGRATTFSQLGKGQHVLALTRTRQGWLVSGAPQ